MKYIITENRINDFANNYLDSYVEVNPAYTIPGFVIVEDSELVELESSESIVMEFDYSDGRLWIAKKFMKRFLLIFGFMSEKTAVQFISDWFSNKFDVSIKYVE